jgi:pyridoxamine 5'-phosphate oxidase
LISLADKTYIGSFRGPPPGKPVSEPYDDKNLKVGTKLDDLDDSIARQNFRVVVIKPESVEQTDLSDPAKARRYLYTFEESSGEWTETEEWP